MRQNDLAWEVRDYLKTHPGAAVVNLGCGLDNTGRACDNGSCKLYNLDFPDVIAVRNQLLPAGEREENIACNLNDTAWFRKIDVSNGAVFFASGVFYYFLKEQVKALVQAMSEAFPGGVLVFDAANRTAVKMIAKTWLKGAKIKDVGAYFAVSDAKEELSVWGNDLTVTSRGYMLGYNDLRDPSVSGFYGMILKIAYYIIVLFTRSAVLFYTNIPGFFKSFGGYDCGIFAVACIMRVFKYSFYGVFRPYGFIFKIYDLFFCQTVSDCRQTFAGQVFIEYSFNRFRFRLIYKRLKSSFFVTE